ncbi:substrate-binding periplasmic protein [Shimia sagamensis]|uniref:Amino acid ABC transporter substrate-binding protein, PAAT family n=1 Tax=Shimia sagamensis TaxID=1566352 RepID=A0ABY1NKW3_9RHOB|nr:transporter substrate-binding domain-containing protein [Shimia sagamensis]SMP12224.1 amino acid ABC transporter substrate-binding protein, PAAT family [Shimia sagamensis]
MKHSLSYMLALTIVLFGTNSSIAETVEFGTFDFAPYVLHDDPEGRLGLFVDITTAIADRAEVPIINSVLPIARVIKNLEHGLTDCVVALETPWTLEHLIQVSEIHDRMEIIFATRPQLDITGISDLHGRRLAIPRGTFRGSPVTTEPDIERVLTNGYEQSIDLLRAGRVDAIAGTAVSLYHSFATENVTRGDIGVVVPVENNSLWLQCAKGQVSNDILAKMDQATTALRDEGAIEAFVQRYIPPEFK